MSRVPLEIQTPGMQSNPWIRSSPLESSLYEDEPPLHDEFFTLPYFHDHALNPGGAFSSLSEQDQQVLSSQQHHHQNQSPGSSSLISSLEDDGDSSTSSSSISSISENNFLLPPSPTDEIPGPDDDTDHHLLFCVSPTTTPPLSWAFPTAASTVSPPALVDVWWESPRLGEEEACFEGSGGGLGRGEGEDEEEEEEVDNHDMEEE